MIYPTQGYSFRFQPMEGQRLHFNWHHHPEYEILVCASGRGQAHIGDFVMEFDGPAAFFIAGGLSHGFASAGTVGGWLIQFPLRDLGNLDGRPETAALADLVAEARNGIRFGDEAAAAAAGLLGRLETREGFPLWLGIVGLLDELSRDAGRRSCSYTTALSSFEAPLDDFDSVVSALFDGAAENQSLSEASRNAGMPVSTFCRTFKRRVGLSFVEYLHSIRINTAKMLLSQTRLHVDDICYEAGFNNVSFFDRKFKQLTGMTPTRYRKTYSAPSPR